MKRKTDKTAGGKAVETGAETDKAVKTAGETDKTALYFTEHKHTKFKCLLAICNAEKHEWVVEILQKAGAHGIGIYWALGIKQTRLKDLLGLKDNHKYLITAFVEEGSASAALRTLQNELFSSGPDTGIAFTLKLDAAAGLKTLMLLENEIADGESEEE